jgi:hypothetical protein
MCAAMRMIFNAVRKCQARTQCRKIKTAREVDPFAAILATSLAAKRNLEIARQQFLLKRAQVFANH